MTRIIARIILALVFIIFALGIVILVFFPAFWKTPKNREESQPRVIIPRSPGSRFSGDDNSLEYPAGLGNESTALKIPLDEGEAILSVLGGNFDDSPFETQLVAYRNTLEAGSPIYLTYIDYNIGTGKYNRVWNVPTAATRPGTISLSTMDLIGDRSVCVILKGVNAAGEHTITIFRKNPGEANVRGAELFSKIVELKIDGAINIMEVTRSQAYQMGFSQGVSFAIACYGRNFNSSNILDQIEIIYRYNAENGLYEQSSRTEIPGAQIEQRRVRELLSSNKAFEEFISGLWYHMTPQGTIDRYQYIYFDPPNREIIFYGDGTQQVFNWQGSTATRNGLYISSQNISISTLRRAVSIELETMDSVRVRVVEDVRLKIGVNAPWDGTYRKANPMEHQEKPQTAGSAHIDAMYDGPLGKIQFKTNGSYELSDRENIRQGKYAFFFINNQEYLELRPAHPAKEPKVGAAEKNSGIAFDSSRETYLVESGNSAGEVRKTLTLTKVKIGSRGIERLREDSISLTMAQK